MNAIRKIEEVKSGSVKIDLPADFQAKKVGVVIMPVVDSEDRQQSRRDVLLEAPTLKDDELKEYSRVRDWMSQWSVKEF